MGRRGLALVVAGPSCVGKGALIQNLLRSCPEVELSISVTTRKPRPGERDGVDYHFISVAEFEQMREAGELFEWARVHEAYYYGTPVAGVREAIEAGRTRVFELDYQGAGSLREKLGSDAVLVFVLPPSFAELQRRQRQRHTEQPDEMAVRLRTAVKELSHTNLFDYLVLNDDLEQASQELQAILQAERTRGSRAGYEGLIAELLAETRRVIG